MIKEKPPIFNEEDFSKYINMYFSNKQIKDTIDHCNQVYHYWDKVKYQAPNELISKEKFWHLLKIIRSVSYNEINFGEFKFTFIITPQITNYLNEIDTTVKKQNIDLKEIPSNKLKNFQINSLYEEAIASSIMEGAATTRKKAKEFLSKNKKKSKVKNNSFQMILNNYKTMEYIVENKDLTLNKNQLLNVHKMITHNTLNTSEYEGKFRNSNDVHVADVTTNEPIYQPPNYVDIDELINQLCNFCNDKNNPDFYIHPIIKAIIIHFMIAFIHPFVDGNGRTARAIFYWYLLKEGYDLTQYLAISRIIQKSKIQYEDSYLKCEYDDNDLTYFIIYNLKSIINAKTQFFKYVDKKLNNSQNIQEYIIAYKINENEASIINELNEKINNYLTVSKTEELLSVSNQTARTYLENLYKKDLLEKFYLNKNKYGYSLKK